MGTCWFCNAKLIWQSDFLYDEWGLPGEGIVAVLICSNPDCNTEARFLQGDDPD